MTSQKEHKHLPPSVFARTDGVIELVKDIVFFLPAIYVVFSLLRLVLIYLSVKCADYFKMGEHVSWQVSLSVCLSLVLFLSA